MTKNFQRNKFIIPILFLPAIIFNGCKDTKQDIKPIEVEIQIIRFEEKLFNMDIYNIEHDAKKLAEQYPDFFPLYTNKIIDIGDISQAWFAEALSAFITDQAIHEIYQRTSTVLDNIDFLIPELEDNFGRYKTLFPESQLPIIYTYISGFNQNIIIAEDILGISLEKYLGINEPLYDKVYPPLGKYQRQNMYPEKIPTDILKAWIQSEFEYKPEQDNLISRMIYEGRNMYLLHVVQPELPDTMLWGFTESKYQFCIENEKQMWKYLIENKLLFSTDNFRMTQFIEDAPFTKDFSKDSPGRAAVWLGYQIVRKYMKKNPDVSFEQIMHETNFQRILNDSKYRPE